MTQIYSKSPGSCRYICPTIDYAISRGLSRGFWRVLSIWNAWIIHQTCTLPWRDLVHFFLLFFFLLNLIVGEGRRNRRRWSLTTLLFRVTGLTLISVKSLLRGNAVEDFSTDLRARGVLIIGANVLFAHQQTSITPARYNVGYNVGSSELPGWYDDGHDREW